MILQLSLELKVFTKKQLKAAAKINQNAVQRVMTMLAEIFTPIIPAIIRWWFDSWLP